MAEKYGTAEQATLFALLLRGPEISNPDLKKEHGVELSPAGRTKLNKAELIETRKEGRRLIHRITRGGEDWCARVLVDIEPPPRSNGLVRGSFELLRLFAGYAVDHEIPLSEVIRGHKSIEELIRQAYGQLSSRPQEWVRLAGLRPKLNGADRSEVDEELLKMTKTGFVHLSPDSDRRRLTDADHAAAIRIGNEDNHLLAIEES